MSKRVFAFGCSYVSYAFPTWADLLSLEFDHFENWGVAGLGCRGIAERVIECHAKNNFTKDDIVIVQWTTHLRHDYYTRHDHLGDRPMPWKTYGSVFNPKNSKFYSKEWFDTFFDPFAYIMHSLNHILMTQTLLESVGCTWYMTSIGNFYNLGTDLNSTEVRYNRQGTLKSIASEFPALQVYVKPIWEDRKDKWIYPIALDADQNQEMYWLFNDQGQMLKEQHPSIQQYALWLNRHLRPKLGLGNPPESQTKWVDAVEKEKKLAVDMADFAERMRSKQDSFDYWPDITWPGPYQGF